MSEKLRRSQVVFNSGPGSIVDLSSYSGIVVGLEEWKNLEKLEEVPTPNRRGFRRLVRPPVLKKNPFSGYDITPFGTMPTFRFPDWVQCTNLSCNAFGPSWKIANGKNEYRCICSGKFVPARIIRICPNGHMDDFPWDQFYHDGAPCELPHPKYRLVSAETQTGSLNDLTLYCKCNLHKGGKPLGSIYEFPLGRHCNGRRPWLSARDEGCDKRSEVVLRGASNVFFPRVMSELIVPKAKTKVELFYSDFVAHHKASYDLLPDLAKGALIEGILDKHSIEVAQIGISRQQLAGELNDLLDDLKRKRKKNELTTEEKIREDEYQILNNPLIVNPDTIPKVYDAKKVDVDPVLARLGLSTLVCVKRLQEIRVLQGFSRVLPNPKADTGKVIDLGEATEGTYLAIEVNGEGLFLSFSNERLTSWASGRDVRERLKPLVGLFARNPGFRPIPFEIDPRAVFLHSFSHALIKQMALFGGYSSVAIREKIYLGPTHNGILIYTGESDSEGTMGGITTLAAKDKFSEIFLEAIEESRWCSSDPICGENVAAEGESENMASCHACLFLSETSCEFSNKFLDRLSIVSTSKIGFFDV